MCIFNSDISQSCTNQKDKNEAKVTGSVSNNRGLHERNNSDSDTKLENQVSSFNFGDFNSFIVILNLNITFLAVHPAMNCLLSFIFIVFGHLTGSHHSAFRTNFFPT